MGFIIHRPHGFVDHKSVIALFSNHLIAVHALEWRPHSWLTLDVILTPRAIITSTELVSRSKCQPSQRGLKLGTASFLCDICWVPKGGALLWSVLFRLRSTSPLSDNLNVICVEALGLSTTLTLYPSFIQKAWAASVVALTPFEDLCQYWLPRIYALVLMWQ